jgi:hypothetical protein
MDATPPGPALPFRAEEVPTFAVLKGYFPTVRVSFERLVATIAERDALAQRLRALEAVAPMLEPALTSTNSLGEHRPGALAGVR